MGETDNIPKVKLYKTFLWEKQTTFLIKIILDFLMGETDNIPKVKLYKTFLWEKQITFLR